MPRISAPGRIPDGSRPWRALLALLAGFLVLRMPVEAAHFQTRNVFLVTTDGLRWEEVFQGADEILMSKEFGNVSQTNELKQRFWRPDPSARREALMPFLWGTVAKRGQLFGNRSKGSVVRVTNGRNFSYPGYNEFLTGYADPRIDSNDKNLNANTNVFEWLNTRPGFRGKVGAVVSWDVIPWILNTPRSGIPVWSGFDVPAGTRMLSMPPALTEMVDHGRNVWAGVLLDTFVGFAAHHAVREFKPRALYVAYGETDDWAHEGHYERYLKAAHEFDRFLGDLWAQLQSTARYRGRTSLVITADHGRGPAPIAWKSHGREIADSAYMWLAVIGPDTPALGERTDVPPVFQAQVAATVAALVGQDYAGAFPQVARPVTAILPAP